MRGAGGAGLVVIGLLSVALAACAVLPREEIAAFTSSYGEVDQAARAIYAEFNAREKAAAGGNAADIDRFSDGYVLVLDEFIDEPPAEDQVVDLSARYAALNAMLAFNEGLAGLAEGRRFEAVRASLAPLSVTLGAAFAPFGAGAAQGVSLVIKGIEEARTREDLVAALGREISVAVGNDGTGESKTYGGHPTIVLLELLGEDVRDMKTVVRGHASERFTEMTARLGGDPDPAVLAARAEVVDDARAFMRALSDYGDLLVDAREYFALLRRAALDQSRILQTAEFVGLTLDMTGEARALIAKL